MHSYHTAIEGFNIFNTFKRCPHCYPEDPCSGKNGQSYWPGTCGEGRLLPCYQYSATALNQYCRSWKRCNVKCFGVQNPAYIRSQVAVEQPRMGESRLGPFSRGTKLQGFWITKTHSWKKHGTTGIRRERRRRRRSSSSSSSSSTSSSM